MNILHLPSWFPNRHFSTSGLFTKKHIESLASLPGTNHIVITWQDTRYATLRNPLAFFRSLIRSLKKPRKLKKGNVEYIVVDLFQSSELIFGSNARRLENTLVRQALDVVRKQSISLVHAHVAYPGGYVAMRVAEETGVPYVLTEHMGPFPLYEYRTPPEWLDERIIQPVQRCKTIVAVSRFHAGQIKSWTGRDPVVIPNVVDSLEFAPDLQPRQRNYFQFVSVSRFVVQKGVDTLLSAVSLLKKTGETQFRICICGEGPLETELKQLCTRLELDRQVEWVDGFDRKAVASRIRSCDCLVSSSRWESFGVTLVEALACGKPVIATRSGGPEDFVNEQNGMLVDIDDGNALAAAMGEMITHAGRYSPHAIREDCLRRFSPEVVARRYATEVYEIQ